MNRTNKNISLTKQNNKKLSIITEKLSYLLVVVVETQPKNYSYNLLRLCVCVCVCVCVEQR